MKSIIAILATVLLAGASIFLRTVELESKSQDDLFTSPLCRSSATFIMNTDKPGQNYFSLAERHFLMNSEEKTEVIVKSCHSLEALLNYLNRNQEKHPWGVINLVVHGNMWGGLSVDISEEGSRAYPKELFAAVNNGALPILGQNVVDEHTKINIWACGIGKNPLINLSLEMLFTNEEGILPQVYASPHFVVFCEDPVKRVPLRLKASYWPYFFRRGYRPSQNEITAQLERDYPDTQLDWRKALQVESPGTEDVTWHEEFNVPVVWTVLYEDKESRPSLGTEMEKLDWIKNQTELMQKIEELEIPLDKYNWSVNKILYKHPDGRIQPAIKAIGMCTVLCVLSPEV